MFPLSNVSLLLNPPPSQRRHHSSRKRECFDVSISLMTETDMAARGRGDSADHSLDQYKSAAKSAKPADPEAVSGGIIANAHQNGSSSSSSVSSGSASAATTSTRSGVSSAASSGTRTTTPSSTSAATATAATTAATSSAASSAADNVMRRGSAGWMMAVALGGAAVARLI